MKLVTNIISWSLVLAIPAFLFVMFWIGTGIQMGQCDTLQDLEIKELITAEEHIAMQMYYQCQDRPDLTKLPFRQAGEVLEIMAKVYPSE